MLVGLVITGMVPYAELNGSSPLATAFDYVGQPWAAFIVRLCKSTRNVPGVHDERRMLSSPIVTNL